MPIISRCLLLCPEPFAAHGPLLTFDLQPLTDPAEAHCLTEPYYVYLLGTLVETTDAQDGTVDVRLRESRLQRNVGDCAVVKMVPRTEHVGAVSDTKAERSLEGSAYGGGAGYRRASGTFSAQMVM
jgi:hypothetical protein